MFNLFGKSKYTVPEPQPLWKSGPEPAENESAEPKEYFRVGTTNDGRITLTFIGDGGGTMTLTMTQSACEQLIRMLRATYDEEEKTETESV
jgi:hypothetical protein